MAELNILRDYIVPIPTQNMYGELRITLAALKQSRQMQHIRDIIFPTVYHIEFRPWEIHRLAAMKRKMIVFDILFTFISPIEKEPPGDIVIGDTLSLK